MRKGKQPKQQINQAKLDTFVNQRRQRNKNNMHESSRQNSDTEVMQPSKSIKNQNQFQQKRNKYVWYPKMIGGPSDTNMYQKIFKSLKQLQANHNPHNKSGFYKFLQDQLKSTGNYKYNIDILKNLQDNQFWKVTLSKMIKLMLNKIDNISCCILTLLGPNNSTVMLTRQQVLLILIAIFFNIMPRSPFCPNPSFKQIMTLRDNDRNQNLKLQKLKFIVNYFNIIIHTLQKQPSFGQDFITFQKASSNQRQWKKSLDIDDYDRSIPMMNVQFHNLADSVHIEDFYMKAAMVDFANKDIGGGVLKARGSVQQQILFLIFPQAIVSMLISKTMQPNQAIIIYGLHRYSKYTGYSDSLKFDGSYVSSAISENINQSVLIAIDAVDYTQKSDSAQYQRQYIVRQIVKAVTGFQGISLSAPEEFSICTGKWGCGAFKGDEIFKFFIQWVACSQAGRNMIYISDSTELLVQFKIAVKKLINKSTLDILSLMMHYNDSKKRRQPENTFLDYLKRFA